MRKQLWLVVSLLIVSVGTAYAQEKSRPEPKPIVETPLRVQVLLSRYDGEKKVSSMPYTLVVNATDDPTRQASLRMGVEVPIRTTVKDSPTVIYRDVGTGIDCSARPMGDGRFRLSLGIRQSSLNVTAEKGGPMSLAEATTIGGNPVLRTFASDFTLLLRDGETAQLTSATDPVNGHVLKVDVTMNVMK